jgi:GAF domain-containing protein
MTGSGIRATVMEKKMVMNVTNYEDLNAQLESLISGVPHRIANLANASALLWQSLEDLNWAGFYLMKDGKLVLGPFQGKPACIEIAVGRGVCGTAAAQDRTQVVPDVHAFPGHIACDCASRSEIVAPIHAGGCVVGVLDIDSPVPERFTEADRQGLEAFVRILEAEWEKMT